MSVITRALVVSGATAGVLACAALTAQAAAPVTLSAGHVDVIDVEYDGSSLGLHVHDESVVPDAEYDPSEVVLRALPASKTTVPGGSQYAFLGSAGAPVWVLPQNQNAALLWPGISTEHLTAGTFQNDRVTVRLKAKSGPGDVSVFKTGSTGSVTKYFDSGDGITSADARAVTVGTHDHANWAFEAAGTYTLTFEVTGVAGGTAKSTGDVAYTFQVG